MYKQLGLILGLFITLVISSPAARSAVILTVNGQTWVSPGACTYYDASLGQMWVAYDCIDIGTLPNIDGGAFPPYSPGTHLTETLDGTYQLVGLDGGTTTLLSKKAEKKIQKSGRCQQNFQKETWEIA